MTRKENVCRLVKNEGNKCRLVKHDIMVIEPKEVKCELVVKNKKGNPLKKLYYTIINLIRLSIIIPTAQIAVIPLSISMYLLPKQERC